MQVLMIVTLRFMLSFRDLARVDALVVPVEAVKRLAGDSDPSISRAARKLLSSLERVAERDRSHRYGKFGL
jgi:hypothetical protein